MTEPAATAERREQILGEVAEGLHAVFKEAQRRTLAAEDNDEFVRLAASLSKVGRGLRQALALHARFERERRVGVSRTDDEAADEPTLDPQEAAVARRKAFVTRGVARCVWSEYDDGDEDEEATAVSLLRDLSDRLDEMADDNEAFLSADVDALIEQFCREVGVDPPERPVRAQLPAAPAAVALQPPFPAFQANGHAATPPDSS